MAAVSIPTLSHTLSSMSGRRVPLSSNPNAVNSPYRGTAASKQKRSYATAQREDSYGGQPPPKKQMLEAELKTPQRHESAEARVLNNRRVNGPQPSALERHAVAVNRKLPQQAVAKKVEKVVDEGLDSIRQWQRHIRRTFPKFVFYFESVPEDARLKCTRQVVALGAREEKFFSNAVTHVVTTRAIPLEHGHSSGSLSATTGPQLHGSHPQTINPSLLERSSESMHAHSNLLAGKGRFTFEVPLSRKPGPHGQEGETRRHQARNADVLYRARELSMKIWALEKLQRMMSTMFDSNIGYQMTLEHGKGSNAAGIHTAGRSNREADLSQLLRNERINGPSDRDPTVASKELNIFKGPFIYIHDLDEKLRPIMVREYAKVTQKADGDWPQFRSVPDGKCPFVEEVDHSRRKAEKEKEMVRLQRQQEREKLMVPATRAAATVHAAKMQPPKLTGTKRPLVDMDDGPNRNITVLSNESNPFDPVRSRFPTQPSSRGTQNAFVSRAGAGRLFAGEPVASGVQPSNITSAIRSQMISSTAAQPGAKAGTSKEVHGLQRKVLEKNSGGPASYGGVTSSHRLTDATTATREDMASRTGKRKEILNLIEEDVDPSEHEENVRKAENARKVRAERQRELEKRELKPGYCENCQDKFDDFDEHILTKKHRKFAEKVDNWRELDALLNQLARPLREAQEDY